MVSFHKSKNQVVAKASGVMLLQEDDENHLSGNMHILHHFSHFSHVLNPV